MALARYGARRWITADGAIGRVCGSVLSDSRMSDVGMHGLATPRSSIGGCA
jgi:hypothetical protein